MTTKIELTLAAADCIRETLDEQCKRLRLAPSQQVLVPVVYGDGRHGTVRKSFRQLLIEVVTEPTAARLLQQYVPDELELENREPHRKGERKKGAKDPATT